MRLGAGLKLVQIEFLEIRLREAPQYFSLVRLCDDGRPDELITRRRESSAGRRFRGVFGVCCGLKSVLFMRNS
jgi:hypothetical protein